MNWVPLSLRIMDGWPHKAKNLQSTWIYSIAEQSTANSRWTAVVLRQVKTALVLTDLDSV